MVICVRRGSQAAGAVVGLLDDPERRAPQGFEEIVESSRLRETFRVLGREHGGDTGPQFRVDVPVLACPGKHRPPSHLGLNDHGNDVVDDFSEPILQLLDATLVLLLGLADQIIAFAGCLRPRLFEGLLDDVLAFLPGPCEGPTGISLRMSFIDGARAPDCPMLARRDHECQGISL
jgi:hypothetical protein